MFIWTLLSVCFATDSVFFRVRAQYFSKYDPVIIALDILSLSHRSHTQAQTNTQPALWII